MKSEAALEQEIRLYVKSTGGNYHKLNANFSPGIPDRIVVYPHCAPIYLELKRPKGPGVSEGKLRPIQQHKKDELITKGFRVHVVKDLDTFQQILYIYSDTKYYAKFKGSETRAKKSYPIYKKESYSDDCG